MTEGEFSLPVITADWEAPSSVVALTTTRAGGVSAPPFDALNLGAHVDDDPDAVRRNRERIQSGLRLPSAPIWLSQMHGSRVAEVAINTQGSIPEADAAVTRQRGCVLAIMTADCLPVVLCSPDFQVIAAVHGGWRSLAADILQNAVLAMDCPSHSVHAWLGPAIGPDCFEVGGEVRDQFVAQDEQMAGCFRANDRQRFMADIYAIARRSLTTLGVNQISGGGLCTYSDSDRFYSYRRTPETGRMATLAWMRP